MAKKREKQKTHNLRKILPIYAENKGKVWLICVFIVITGTLGIASPIISANILSGLAESKFNLAITLAAVLVAINLVKIVFNGFTESLYVRVNARVQHSLTDKLIRAINQTKMSKLESVKIGAIAERLGTDVHTIGASYLQVIDMIFEIITNLAFFIYIAFLNIWIFLILLVYVIILYAICIYKARVWIQGVKKVKKVKDKARSSYYEQVTGVRDIKLLNAKENVTSYSNALDIDFVNMNTKFNDKRNVIRRVQQLVSAVFAALFIVLGIVFVKSEFLLLTGFLVIYSYYGRVEGLVQYISSLKENLAEGEIAASRVFEVIDGYEKEEYGTKNIEKFSGKIELKNIEFSYDGEIKVLNKINMEFLSGQMTAIVGPSGSGKTTILSIISKLYDISGGEILLDGENIKDLTENAIRSNIGVVSQSPYIFNTTIKQNLLFVKPDASDDEIIDVLKQAQIYGDIEKLENGIDSEIGENGIKLSGGQKQRIAIARLLLMNSKVIVFDEATSALDNANQKKIVDLLENMKADKTIIIVAHRLSTIVGADKIYVIENGKNVAEGTHRQLLKNNEVYRNLYLLEEESSKDEQAEN